MGVALYEMRELAIVRLLDVHDCPIDRASRPSG